MKKDTPKIAVIGLGYVGLPLAIEFAKKYQVVGFDVSKNRVDELCHGFDKTLEVEEDCLKESRNLTFTNATHSISNCNCFIVTVPTPIDEFKKPDLEPLVRATKMVGACLKVNDVVIYESTVYPGAVEEDLVPLLEESSNLKFNHQFFCGYSPERINPGDKKHTLTNIVKITSGSNKETAQFVNDLYGEIIEAGTFLADSIRVAEAAKVIENTQRDLNIALINELAQIFSKMEIDTHAVLKAAETKWNFLPFKPGLVGGHCIGVDPYYLTHKAQQIDYHPEVILAGRRLNDGMGRYVARLLIKKMAKKSIDISTCRVLVMGLSFKENCPDLRNTRVIDIIAELRDHGVRIDVYDPWVNKEESIALYKIDPSSFPEEGIYDGIMIANAHTNFYEMGIKAIRKFGTTNHVVFDLKAIFDQNDSDIRL